MYWVPIAAVANRRRNNSILPSHDVFWPLHSSKSSMVREAECPVHAEPSNETRIYVGRVNNLKCKLLDCRALRHER